MSQPEQRQMCTFFLAGHHLGIPVERVQEILRAQPLTRFPLASPVVSGLMNLRGRIAIVLDLRRRFGFADRAEGAPAYHIVVESKGSVVSLVVDAVGDVLDVPTDMFEPPPETLQGAARTLIRGAYKLPKGLLLAIKTDEAVAIPADA